MRIFVAGATGAIGRQLIPRLVAQGHQVHGMTRHEASAAQLRELGAEPVIADALDAGQVKVAVTAAEPELMIHQLTAIPAALDMRRMDREFAMTNRLRSEGTDNLIAAAQAAGVRRVIAQSIASYGIYARTGGPVKSEDDATEENPVRIMRDVLGAVKHLEGAVLGASPIEGVVLRYGVFYGPGTAMASGAPQAEMVRKRRFPLVGSGAGMWSFIHVADAAEATVAAVDHGAPGIYNIVDDEPAPVAEWLPALAGELGVKGPMKVPTFIAKLAAGEAAAMMMTEVRGASNAKAKRELGWQPAHSTWRGGMLAG